MLAVLMLSGCSGQLRAATVQPAAAAYECDCAVPVDGELRRRPDCLHREGAVYRMDPRAVAAFGQSTSDSPFEAWSQCGVFHVRRDGRALPTHLFDNGPDPFCSGLARYVVDGKLGYMNRALEVVVPATYDFAFPFDGERGPVCNQCAFQSDGEHTAVSCASCGAVDKDGKLTVPLQLSSEALFAQYPAHECN